MQALHHTKYFYFCLFVIAILMNNWQFVVFKTPFTSGLVAFGLS